MPQYLFSVHLSEGEAPTPPGLMERMFANVGALNQELQDSGAFLFAGGLQEPSTAYVANGHLEGTDSTDNTDSTPGPVLPGSPYLSGMWILELPADQVEAIAKRASAACMRAVEVRPFQ